MIEYKPEDVLSRLRQSITKGTFTIIPRCSFIDIVETYLIDESKIKYILLNLSKEDYIGSEDSYNMNYQDDVVHIFEKDVEAIRKYSDTIESEKIRLYIKFTWSKSADGNLIIISFHLSKKN